MKSKDPEDVSSAMPFQGVQPMLSGPARSEAERPTKFPVLKTVPSRLQSAQRMSPERPPKVFISYSHDSDEHMERVLSLADRLRASGVNAMIDQYVHDPEDGWQIWTEAQMRDSDLVLVVCTETYLKRAERREEPGTGHGASGKSPLVMFSFTTRE